MNRFIRLLRVTQWYKNLVVFLALFYTRNLLNPQLLAIAGLGFISLCLISSSGYILNDIRDRREDSKHPEKRSRPIASGEVSVATGYAISALLFVISLGLSYSLNPVFLIYTLGLFVSSTLYTLGLKNVAFVDFHMIALNFLIRAVAGAVVIGVPASPWLIATVYFMALFLAIAKRKGELILLGEKAGEHRMVYGVYSAKLLGDFLVLITAVLMFTYILYTFIAYESNLLMLTIPFASIILMRYMYLVEEGHIIARKTQYFFKDRELTITFILWVVSTYVILSSMT